MVGYLGMPVPIRDEDYKRLLAKYDKERLVKASQELIDIDHEKKIASLKADVRKHCTAIIGPSPEDWDTFYAGIENPPPNPYKLAKPEPTEKETTTAPVAPSQQPGMSSEELLCKLTDAAIEEHLDDIRKALTIHGPRSRQGRLLKKDLAMAEAEAARRSTEIDAVAEAVADAITAETGMVCQVTKPDKLNPKTTIVAPVGLVDVTTLTDTRLHELLDMNLRELETNDRDTLCYEEASRDVKLIEAERRRRDDPEREAASGYSDEDLHEAVHEARKRYNSLSVNSREGKRASREIDVLNEEFRRRGLTLPVLRQGDERKKRQRKVDAT
jgi:hypothetical protein